jgi:hypothetical protein
MTKTRGRVVPYALAVMTFLSLLAVAIWAFTFRTHHVHLTDCRTALDPVDSVVKTLPKAIAHHLVLRPSVNGDAHSTEVLRGRVIFSYADGPEHIFFFQHSTLMRCNWFRQGPEVLPAYVILTTQPGDTQYISITRTLRPEEAYHIGCEIDGDFDAKWSLWLTWVDSPYFQLHSRLSHWWATVRSERDEVTP